MTQRRNHRAGVVSPTHSRLIKSTVFVMTVLLSAVFGLLATPATARAADQADLSVAVYGPSEVIDQRNPDMSVVAPGAIVTYWVGVTNVGSAVAHDVTVAVTLPDSLILRSQISGPSCTSGPDNPQLYTCMVGDLEPGREVGVGFRVRIGPVKEVVVTGTVSSSTAEATLDNNQAQSSITFTDEADMWLADPWAQGQVSEYDGHGTDQIYAGGVVNVGAYVGNAGPDSSLTADYLFEFGDGLTAAGDAWPCSNQGTSIRCISWARYDANMSTGTHVLLRVPSDATGELTVKISLVGGSYDPDLSNNSTEVTFTVAPASADLSITNTASVTQAKANDQVTWTLQARNAGPSIAEDVVITDTIPVGMSLTAVPDDCSVEGRMVTCPVGDLPTQDLVTRQVTAVVDAGRVPLRFVNHASVTSTTADPTGPNTADSTVRLGSTSRTTATGH